MFLGKYTLIVVPLCSTLETSICPSLCLNNTIAGGKTEPSTFADIFGGEERFENVRHSLFVHTGTRIADRQFDIITGFDIQLLIRVSGSQMRIGCFYGYCAAIRHGITSVNDKICQYLFDLALVGL